MNKNTAVLLLSLFLLPGGLAAQEYGYDASGRLTSAWYPSGQAIAYAYDPAGNLTSRGVFADQDLDGIHDQWEINFFGSRAAGDPLADGEKDQLKNRVEFALGRNPEAFDSSGVTVLSRTTDEGQEYLEFTYRRAKLGALFNSYKPEISFDAQTWHSGPAHIQQIGNVAEIDADTEELKFRVLTPVETAGRILVRLNISKKQ